MITLTEAVARYFEKTARHIVTYRDVYSAVADLYKERRFDGEELRLRRTHPTARDISNTIKALIRQSRLLDDLDLTGAAYRITLRDPGTAEEVCCEADPYCYISHLSAMQRYGLTNRTPTDLHVSRPSKQLWRQLSLQDQARDFGSTLLPKEDWPTPWRPNSNKIRRRTIAWHDLGHPGESIQLRDSTARISKIGQTFIDMLAESAWCGGMSHVLDVWQEHASTYLEEIIAAVEKAPKKLTKVRAGYILEERLRLHDARINAWREFAQRGSSQKLDPNRDYAPTYSEKWMLSLNV